MREFLKIGRALDSGEFPGGVDFIPKVNVPRI